MIESVSYVLMLKNVAPQNTSIYNPPIESLQLVAKVFNLTLDQVYSDWVDVCSGKTVIQGFIDRWRDGDPSCHCTHCDICGLVAHGVAYLFKTHELAEHVKQAHLGGKQQLNEHIEQGLDLLRSAALQTDIRLTPKLKDWYAKQIQIDAIQLKLREPRQRLRKPPAREENKQNTRCPICGQPDHPYDCR